MTPSRQQSCAVRSKPSKPRWLACAGLRSAPVPTRPSWPTNWPRRKAPSNASEPKTTSSPASSKRLASSSSVLRAEVEKLTTPPNNFGTVLQVNSDGTVDVMTGNRKLRVGRPAQHRGQAAFGGPGGPLNESLQPRRCARVRAGRRGGHGSGRSSKTGRVVVMAHADEEQVLELADSMKDKLFRGRGLRAGGPQVEPDLRAPGPSGGRGAGAGRGPRRDLQPRRRAGRADRGDPGRGRAAVCPQGPVRRIWPRSRPKAFSCTALPAAARP